MKVDISNILKINGASQNVEFNEVMEGFNLVLDDFSFDEPVSFKGSLVNIGGIIKLEGDLRALYITKCSRCLKDIKSEVLVTVKEDFIEEGKDKDDEAYTYQGKYVELDKVLKDNIILNLPAKQICEGECKGLCPKCGNNLNDKDCECRDEEINPRMEALKDFFKN